MGARGWGGGGVGGLLDEGGATIGGASRPWDRAEQGCDDVRKRAADADLEAWETRDNGSLSAAVRDAEVVIAAGAPGVELLPEAIRRECKQLKVAIDLNAVPPTCIAGIHPTDKSADHDGPIC